ncbi:MAG TPA: hypothetical protein VFE53_14760 [Mucilaginibacter sp.]|nr:hypothetical protein [Mucilaginibacter sp.]
MKKIILAGMFCIAATTILKAQGSKGNLFVGTDIGSTSYNSINMSTNTNGNIITSDTKEYTIGVAPAIGIFLSDHLVFGGDLSVNYTYDKDNETDNSGGAVLSSSSTRNITHFDIGPFVRYYFFADKPSKTMFYLQANGTVGAGSGSGSITDASAVATNSNISGLFVYSAGGSVGISHYILKNVGLNFGLGYSYLHQSYSNNSGSTTSSITSGNSGISLSAGFHVILP